MILRALSAVQPTLVALSGYCGSLIGIKGPCKVVKLGKARVRPKKAQTMDASLSPQERLAVLQTGGVKDKKGVVWEGPSQEIAQRLVEFLSKRDLLPP